MSLGLIKHCVTKTYVEMSGQLKPPVSSGYEAWWTPEPIWMMWRKDKYLFLPGI
jgi:hypothetical protein